MNSVFSREIAIIQKDVYEYPGAEDVFSPSQIYPEYPFEAESAAKQTNIIYEMIREGFMILGLDAAHIGTSDWNPLGEFIKHGDFVLLKPNMVLHENHIPENGTHCLVTHPSIVRAVLDFVVIALGNTGRITIGDAPLQSCDFNSLISSHGYDSIVRFYHERGIDVELEDFRMITSKVRHGFVDADKKKGKSGCTAVDLGSISMQKSRDYSRLRVTSYDPDEMKIHHNSMKHEYLIADSVLAADVIINLPKPKTHRKAGITGALKNLIGINGNKDWLPHHTKGAKEDGGDEYLHRNLFKAAESNVQDAINRKIKEKTFPKSLKILQHGMSVLGNVTAADAYREGSWYGNDTIWRTISDLNRILLYCDKKGMIRKNVQRKIFVIGDMIISGEGEGPLMPSPIVKGILLFGNNPAAFDTVIAEIMGFDYRKIPSIYKCYKKSEYPLVNFNKSEIKLKMNDEGIMDRVKETCFRPSSGWKGHIEK